MFKAGSLALVLSTIHSIAQAQAWDTSGNGLLKGTYYFRNVVYLADRTGSLGRALSFYGNMNFDGNGNYTISNGTLLDSNTNVLQGLSVTGTYSIAASGQGFLSHPLSTPSAPYTLFGLVANGVLIGSATDNGFNDLLIAAPIPSPLPTASFLNGSYTVAGFLPSGSPANAADSLFQLNADGAGNLGPLNITGYVGGGGTTQYTQTNSGVKYVVNNGAAAIQFPVSNTALFYSGNEYVYFSPDGNLIFGGSPVGYDMIIGVKNGSTTDFSGLYYQAGIDEDTSTFASAGFATFDTYYGSSNVTGGNILGHKRLSSPSVSTVAQGFTYADTYSPSFNGSTYTSPNGKTQYFFGNSGGYRLGFGVGPALSLSIGVRAPKFSGAGVYLDPTGVSNAASAAPFTAGISEGEFLVLYGSNLSSKLSVAATLPFPTSLNGVQVSVNGVPAPLYYVSPTQVSLIVPFGTNTSTASIQLTNNGVQSNAISQFVNLTTPGLFSLTANGLGYGAIEHAIDGSVVTASHPAKAGENISMFLAGLGAVSPAITTGQGGPYTEPLSRTTNNISVKIAGRPATVLYQGLAPYLAGLYQMNVTIPAATPAGDATVEIIGPDSDNMQGLIPVAP